MEKNKKLKWNMLILLCISLFGCHGTPPNHPHVSQWSNEKDKVVYYSTFSESPKTLDPARSYSSDEAVFTGNIYESVLEYHYLKRPYVLIPLTAEAMPKIEYFNARNQLISREDISSKSVAYTVYTIKIKPGIYYQPHPAFAKDQQGQTLYFNLDAAHLRHIHSPIDFAVQGTRELTADDYVYEIKRLASPLTQSPILSVMEEHLVGLSQFKDKLQTIYDKQFKEESSKNQWFDLRPYSFPGVKTIDRYTFQIKIKGQYPQFSYWLAMPFFAPIPWEAEKFYAQKSLQKLNISLDTYPVGTGAYMLVQNDPNREMILAKNPNFHEDFYPNQGEENDLTRGYLDLAGKKLPFIDVFHFSLEKESIPRWVKFLQGYYDQSGISSDQYDNVIQVDEQGQPHLSAEMKNKNVSLQTQVSPAIFYMGFNMQDPIVGGYSENARKLRQAISIAVDFNEYISIFLNGRGIVADSPIPPGIFGYRANGVNNYVFQKNGQKVKRQSLDVAKKLLAEAGYPNGRDPKTGESLILNFDTAMTNGPDDKAQLQWFREQFRQLGIDLQIRSTQYNQFQQKMRAGNAQIYMWGWQADYPDPENFLFLLFGPNGQVRYGGENTSNYESKTYDELFLQMKNMPNSPQRQAVIAQMLNIIEQDSPWVWGFYPKTLSLNQQWVSPLKPHNMGNNTLKYLKINAKLRQQKQILWNKPLLWPIVILGGLLLFIIALSVLFYKKHQNKISKRV